MIAERRGDVPHSLAALNAAPTHLPGMHPGRVLGYIRLDRAGIAGRVQLDAQKHQIDWWATAHHARRLRTYVDAAPASVPAAQRPALQKLLADVVAGRVETVVCTALDCLAREQAVLEEIARMLDAHGISLVVLEQGIAPAGGTRADTVARRAGSVRCQQEQGQ